MLNIMLLFIILSSPIQYSTGNIFIGKAEYDLMTYVSNTEIYGFNEQFPIVFIDPPLPDYIPIDGGGGCILNIGQDRNITYMNSGAKGKSIDGGSAYYVVRSDYFLSENKLQAIVYSQPGFFSGYAYAWVGYKCIASGSSSSSAIVSVKAYIEGILFIVSSKYGMAGGEIKLTLFVKDLTTGTKSETIIFQTYGVWNWVDWFSEEVNGSITVLFQPDHEYIIGVKLEVSGWVAGAAGVSADVGPYDSDPGHASVYWIFIDF